MESFCVRTSEFESIIETLRENTGQLQSASDRDRPSWQRQDEPAASRSDRGAPKPRTVIPDLPITFAEESYEVSTCGEFWLECLSRLADQALQPDWESDLGRTYQDLRTIQDDRMLADRCLGALLDFSDRAGKRLLLAVENLNMMFTDMLDPDAGWRLRKTPSDRAADHPARKRYQPVRGDRSAGSSPVRPVPRDQPATTRRAGNAALSGRRCWASVLKVGKCGLCRS